MATIQYLVNAVDNMSGPLAKMAGSASALGEQLQKLNDTFTAKVELEGGAKAQAQLGDIGVKLARLDMRATTIKMNSDQLTRATIQAAALGVALDKIGDARTTAGIIGGRGGIRSILGGLFSGGTGGIGGLLAGAGPAAGGIGGAAAAAAPGVLGAIFSNPYSATAASAAAVGGVAAGALGIIPALAAAGQAVVAFGALAYPTVSAVSAGFTAVSGAVGKVAKDKAWDSIPVSLQPIVRGVLDLVKTFDRLATAFQPFVTPILGTGLKIVGQILQDLAPFAQAAARAIEPLLEGFNKFLASPGAAAFQAQMVKLAGPTITVVGQGLGQIAVAVGKLLLALVNPDALRILKYLLDGIALSITGLADAFTFMTPLVITFFHDMAVQFDDARHRTAADIHNISDWIDTLRVTWVTTGHALEATANAIVATFDQWRHSIASAFDDVRHTFAGIGHDIAGTFDAVRHFQGQFDAFGKDIGFVRHVILAAFDDIRHGGAIAFDDLRHFLATDWDRMWHDTMTILDTLRHGIAAAWDAIWRDTNANVKNGLGGIVGWFKGFPGRVVSALGTFGRDLYNTGHQALTDFLHGLESIGGSVISWIGNFVSNVWDKVKRFFGMSPPHPGSKFYDLGRDMMLHLAAGIKSHANKAAAAATAVSRQVTSAGAGVQQWARLVSQALRMEGLSPSLLGNVLFQMQTESGGNPNAINQTDLNARMGDPSRGLMQVIGTTFNAYHWPGTSGNIYDPLANIAAALNYARHVYGPTLMSGGMGIGSGHGYALGGVIGEPITGWGRSGRRYTFGERGPETVTPGTGGVRRGPLVQVGTMVVQDATDAELVAQRLSFRVTAAGLGS